MNKNKKALALAIAGIYFADSSDYGSYLWQIVAVLDPAASKLLEDDEAKAYKKYSDGNV